MPTNDKSHILTGDTFAVSFEALEPVAEDENSFAFARTPINPTSAVAKLWSVNDQAYLSIGSTGDLTEAAANVSANIVSYTVSGTHTTTAGDYKLFISVTFPDGQIVSEVRQFRVKEKQ